MIDVSWHIEDEDRETELTGSPRPLLGTWHYLRNSLRREWRTWLGLAALGAVLGAAVVILLPPSSKGTVTLLMAHPASVSGQSAMATDVTMLTTREVAARTVRALGLDMSPAEFQSTIGAEPVTTEILHITVSAPDDRSAVARTDELTAQYLEFRATQLRSLSSGLIDGYESRIASMREEVTALNREYSQAVAQGAPAQARASEILTRRTELNSEIIDLQQAIEDAALTADAAISSTHVMDPTAAGRRSQKKTLVLNVGSGLVAGTGLGVGFVLFRALTTNRVRRRQDVALALGAPVRFGVRSPGPSGHPLRFRRRSGWHGQDLEALAQGLSSALPGHTGMSPRGVAPALQTASGVSQDPAPGASPAGVALAAVDNARAAAAVLAALAARLRAQGVTVLLVDLSPSGALASYRPRPGRAPRAGLGLRVFRPGGVLALARGLRGAPGSAWTEPDDDLRERWDSADVVLALADVNPGLDAESLGSWVGQVVPLVTAGKSSPELLRTTAELIRAADLGLPFVMMVNSDETDESLGLVQPDPGVRTVAASST